MNLTFIWKTVRRSNAASIRNIGKNSNFDRKNWTQLHESRLLDWTRPDHPAVFWRLELCIQRHCDVNLNLIVRLITGAWLKALLCSPCACIVPDGAAPAGVNAPRKKLFANPLAVRNVLWSYNRTWTDWFGSWIASSAPDGTRASFLCVQGIMNCLGKQTFL